MEFLHAERGAGGIASDAHLMVLPVRMRIHWGMGLFCFCFLPRIFLVLNVFWDGCEARRARGRGRQRALAEVG